jgi:hypothetical protein
VDAVGAGLEHSDSDIDGVALVAVAGDCPSELDMLRDVVLLVAALGN